MENPLGQKSAFPTTYAPEVLYRVPRNRSDLGGAAFNGVDRWVCYELTWLDLLSTPQAAVGQLLVPANSPYLVESKSLKLYLGSFSFEAFKNEAQFCARVQRDLSTLLVCPELSFEILSPSHPALRLIQDPEGRCIDHHTAPTRDSAMPSPEYLQCESGTVSEVLHSNLFRSLCPVTAQPDFATVEVAYSGAKISEQSLLQYLCSFRNAAGFHEHCCEQIFFDLSQRCKPSELTVSCYFTRRGGIEINPFRTSLAVAPGGLSPTGRRMIRQ
jgi:7-cyano-7-deazaguanine reductase